MGAVSLSTGQRAWGRRAYKSRPYHILLPRHHVGHRYYIGHYTVGSQTNLARIVLRPHIPSCHHSRRIPSWHRIPIPNDRSPMMLGAVSKPVGNNTPVAHHPVFPMPVSLFISYSQQPSRQIQAGMLRFAYRLYNDRDARRVARELAGGG
jgi:hypothetical protein